MKRLLCVFLALFLLSGCESEAKFNISAKWSENAAVNMASAAEENSPEFFGNRAWLDGGKTLAVQSGFTVHYIDAESKAVKEIKLSAEGIENASDCIFANYGIFMGTGRPIEKEGAPGPAICLIGGEWKLCGGIFFDREGNIIRKLPEIENPQEGEALPLARGRWLGDDVMAFFGGEHLFFYRISEDRLYLSEKNLKEERETL